MKYDLSQEQVSVLKEKFDRNALGAGVISVVIQPTGERGIKGQTRGRVRVLHSIRTTDQAALDRSLVAAIKDNVGDVFRSVHITLTRDPDSFVASVNRDGIAAERAHYPHRRKVTPIGRDTWSGTAILISYKP